MPGKSKPADDVAQPSVLSVALWACRYVLQSRGLLMAVVVSRLMSVCLDLIKPWPMALLVDCALRGKKVPAPIAACFAHFGFPTTSLNLINVAVIATILVFILGWLIALINGYSVICLRQRMNYGLAANVFSKL